MKLYLAFFAMHLKSQMQYKASFFMMLFGQFLTSFTALVSVWFMFMRFHEVEGFRLPEVLLCFSTVLFAFSVAECFGRGFDLFPRVIANGEFDRALVRPRNEIFLVLAGKMDFSRLGRFFQAALVLAYAIPQSGVVWTPDKIFTLTLMILCGVIVFFCLFLIYAALSFFTMEGLEFMNVFTDGGREFGRYPFSIYGEDVLRFLTYVIPLALFQYYPLLYLLDKDTSVVNMLSPLFSLLFAFPAYGLWRYGLRRYKSTGS